MAKTRTPAATLPAAAPAPTPAPAADKPTISARKAAPKKAPSKKAPVKKTPATKTSAKQPAAPIPAQAAPQPAAAEKPAKPKLVRDSFTIPRSEYQALEALKQRLVQLTRPTKKSELLRAGLQLLAALPDAKLLAAVRAVPSIKTGRPGKNKA
jgi:hypothetical protein